ncbi:MAG: ABC transporter permease [Candidatus Magasanikbacteria bacterium]|nr:ABC transporter permease [Candidatus Magasanikbacteria bacterium]
MEIVIKPKNKWWQFDWKEIWLFRDLFYFLTWRDVKVRYKQTTVGALWAIFQPLITMIVFTIFFGKFAKMPSDGIPYPIFVYSGLLFWTLFSAGLSHASNSFIDNEKIVTKIYFPRVILPTSAIITNIIDFLVASIILAVMMFVYHFSPSLIGLLLLPLLIVMTVFSTLGIGLLLASLNVKYRDVRFILPFFIQLLLFITPVIYPVSIVSAQYRWILGLNPMSGIIDAVRAGVLGTRDIDWLLLGVSAISMIVYCIVGYLYFKKVERYFADVI